MNSATFKARCIELRAQGYTLGEISSITKRPRNSVHFHVENLRLSEAIWKKIRARGLSKIVAKNKTRRGISRLGRDFYKFTKWTPELVNLVGHLIFDGEIRNRKCIYNNRSKTLIDDFRNSMKLIYDFEPRTYFKEKTGVVAVAYFNVALADYLQDKADSLLKEIHGLSKELQRKFLNAFFDDEGAIYFVGKNRRVKGYQHSAEILELIQKLLRNFGIESRIDYKYYELTVSRKENLEKFQKEINFSKGLGINPNRSNSVWKRPIEKREILKLALASYQN